MSNFPSYIPVPRETTTATPALIVFNNEVDTLIGGEGADSFFLRLNRDQFSPLPPAVSLIGTNKDDTLNGTINRDVIQGQDGNDRISSFLGDDIIEGQNGNDIIFSGKGNDLVIGNSGVDTLFGDIGIDTVYGGLEKDLLFGNNDEDTLFGDGGDDSIYGGQGNDSLIGGTGNDLLLGDRGNDTILGISDVNLGYSLVKDFNRNEDKLILVGTKDLYTIGSLPANVPQGVAIFKLNTDGSQQLLAVVQGNISSTLDSSEYVFF
ncbi:MAG TPA: calcium-binding protein [Planktothrix sp. UBA8407]|jgi:RTX toxins and related Ca2+-binding proteins|nr:calcium-binding protein [Planktothrix sp. UBA8407]HBK24129.1 calcium-binding protein [Planktothrix sp. UBA10369]